MSAGIADVGPGRPATAPVLSVRNLSKTFPGTQALKSVDLDVRRGEVHALLGQNGSGKSTLIKVLAGYHRPDPGASIWLDGHNLTASRAAGIGSGLIRFVHQDLGLVLELSAMDNLALLSRYVLSATGRVKWRDLAERTTDLLARFGVHLDVRRPLAEAAPVERTILAIAAALEGLEGSTTGLLVLDEPTAVLPANEVEKLFSIVRQMKAAGISILYVSHRLDEIFEIADRVTVLRDGRRAATQDVPGLTRSALVSLLLGAEIGHDLNTLPAAHATGRTAVQVKGASGRYMRNVSLTLQAGEVLGVAGLPGSGREELPYALAGALKYDVTGTISFGAEGSRSIPLARARGAGVALVPADRATEGLIDQMTVRENLTLSILGSLTKGWTLSGSRERQAAETWMARLSVVAAGMDYPIKTLSGGNQQKVMIARSLARGPKVLVLSEPTAGVDIGARHAIYQFISGLTEQGLGVLMASSDIADLVAMCNRVLLLREGIVCGELEGDQVTEHAILRAIEGIPEEEE
jgi:ABC-type sugar transport system ATPase subunit